MCETCGCSLKSPAHSRLSKDTTLTYTQKQKPIGTHSHDLLHSIMSSNDEQAAHNRKIFNHHNIVAINIMSSPGSGKTTLLEATIANLKSRYRIAVIEGDLETENDANRIRKHGVAAIQITTGSACHLDAHYIQHALDQLDLAHLDLVFIENVGNLVCPAAFDLGQHHNIALLSVTEGDDKPLKYPVMFQKIDGLILSKTELLAYFDDFSIETATENFRKLANRSPVWSLSAKTNDGVDAWIAWLEDKIRENASKTESAA